MREIARNTTARILKEQFIPDNVFVYVAKGSIRFFDGTKTHTITAGECVLARKNRLVKFLVMDNAADFEPVLLCFDEPFLREHARKHPVALPKPPTDEAVVRIPPSALISSFIRSLEPYYKGVMALDEDFEDLKYEELLVILLKTQPALAGILFDFGIPAKINLEAFMNQHYHFNVSVERFAYLTGRSLSAFKRDFRQLFNETPSRWLTRKRLQEAYLLISRQHQKPAAIYLELGFESLSHFSVAFKKQFGLTPTALAAQHA